MTKVPPEALEAWADYDPPEFKHESNKLRDAFLSGWLANTRPKQPMTVESNPYEVERAWREGWATCKGCLAEDASFELTADVEEDAWRDSDALSAVGESREGLIAELREALEPFANMADANMHDPLSKWLTVGQIKNAGALITKDGGSACR